jgi:hypothetical protein
MKFGVDIMPLDVIPNSYFLIFYNRFSQDDGLRVISGIMNCSCCHLSAAVPSTCRVDQPIVLPSVCALNYPCCYLSVAV